MEAALTGELFAWLGLAERAGVRGAEEEEEDGDVERDMDGRDSCALVWCSVLHSDLPPPARRLDRNMADDDSGATTDGPGDSAADDCADDGDDAAEAGDRVRPNTG